MTEKETKDVKIKLSNCTVANLSLDIAWSIYLEESQYREEKPMEKRKFAKLMEPYLPNIMEDVHEFFIKSLGEMELEGSFMNRFYEEEDDYDFDMDLSFLDDIE